MSFIVYHKEFISALASYKCERNTVQSVRKQKNIKLDLVNLRIEVDAKMIVTKGLNTPRC